MARQKYPYNACKTLRDADIEVSLFIDPDLDQVKAAHGYPLF